MSDPRGAAQSDGQQSDGQQSAGQQSGGRPMEGRPRGGDPIQKIFPIFTLAMWVVAGFMIADGAWTGLNTLVLVVAALICAITFVNFVYVFNYGYAAAMVVLSVLVLVVRGPSPVALALGVLLVIFGLRLAWFVSVRYRTEAYAGQKFGQAQADKHLPGFVKGLIYVQTTTLQTFFPMALIAAATAEKEFDAASIVGLVLVAVGVVVEAVADQQKQRAKAAAPRAFVSSGLFARSRHPNYLGEILVQLGVIVVGLSAASAWTDGAWYGWAAVVLAPAYIVILMLSATYKGEQAKQKSYGQDPEFVAYAARSGVLLPSLRG